MTSRVAAVTGGSAGIGRAICEDLLAQGYEVVSLARRRAEIDHPKLHSIEVVAAGSDKERALAAAVPVRRLGEAADVARAVRFFVDAANGFVTGQVLYVCGGTSVGSLTL